MSTVNVPRGGQDSADDRQYGAAATAVVANAAAVGATDAAAVAAFMLQKSYKDQCKRLVLFTVVELFSSILLILMIYTLRPSLSTCYFIAVLRAGVSNSDTQIHSGAKM